MDEENVVCSYNRLSFSLKREENCNMSQHALCLRTPQKSRSCMIPNNMTFKTVKFTNMESGITDHEHEGRKNIYI